MSGSRASTQYMLCDLPTSLLGNLGLFNSDRQVNIRIERKPHTKDEIIAQVNRFELF